MDLNDRALRSIKINLGKLKNNIPRNDGFDITVASEVMAIFCLSNNLEDLENKIGNITIGGTTSKTITLLVLKLQSASKRIAKWS